MEKVKIGKYSMESEEWSYVSVEAKVMVSRMLQRG
jgi:hypothetical protein